MISDKRINVIYSKRRNEGTTWFLYQLATILDYGYSVCFIDGDGSGTDNEVFGEKTNFLRLLNKNDVRMYEMINQLKDIDIVLIDDVHMLKIDSAAEILTGSKYIICTCPAISQTTKDSLFEKYGEVQQFFLDKKTIEHDNNIIDRKSFLNRIKRDLKIKSLLNGDE